MINKIVLQNAVKSVISLCAFSVNVPIVILVDVKKMKILVACEESQPEYNL